MGRNNRQRRAMKRRERSAGQSRQPHHTPRHGQPAEPPPSPEAVLQGAAHRWFDDRGTDVTTLVADTESADGHLAAALGRLLEHAVSRAWDRGWQPLDLFRLARRELGPAHQVLGAAAIAVESRAYARVAMPPHWRSQLVEIGADAPRPWGSVDLVATGRVCGLDQRATLVAGIELLAILERVPSLPRLCPPPREWGTTRGTAIHRPATHDPVVAKVRALLAKAESTEFPAEAESLTAKAQELITRHAIDDAVLDPAMGDAPTGRRVPIDDPYATAKAQLLAAVAAANRCQAVQSSALGFTTVMGFERDLDTVELLFASLLVQATRALAVKGREDGARARRPAYRRAFLYGFATQVGRRLADTSERETDAATSRHGPVLLPVLARRAHEVDHAVKVTFPHVTYRRPSISDEAGWVAGRAAGQSALLSLDSEVVPGLTA